jgi:pimeloyl-ACP methyl ester carboxylesterase
MDDLAMPSERVAQFSLDRTPVHGIVHSPPESTRMPSPMGVIFINAGIRSRRGPGRIYVRMARRLCRAGYHAFRFDLPGIGDSPGWLESVSEYKKKFLDCTECAVHAIDYLQGETGVERVAVVGMCGGAFSAMMCSAIEPRISHLVLASLPVQPLGDMSEDAVSGIALHNFLHKARRWHSWRKFLTGRSQYRWAARALGRLLTGGYRGAALDSDLWCATEAFMRTRRRALFIFGGRDPFYPAFATVYRRRLSEADPDQRYHTVRVIEEAGHDFAQCRWQEQVLTETVTWLDEQQEAALAGTDERRLPAPLLAGAAP